MESSTAAEAMHRVLGMVAVHQCWVTARLFEVQKPIGVFAVQGRLIPACLTVQQGCRGHAQVLGIVAVHHCWVTVRLCEVQKPIGVFAVTSKADSSLPLRAALLQRPCTGSYHGCCASVLGHCKAV